MTSQFIKRRIKLFVFSSTFLITTLTYIFTPKVVFEPDLPYRVATSMAITDEDNLLLYDYKVYSTDTRFENGLVEDLAIQKAKFLERNEIMLVKIPGDPKVEFFDDYVLVQSQEVPELNIEYYLVQNISIADISVPARTLVMLFQDVIALVNNVYFIFLGILFFLLFIPQLFTIVSLILGIVDEKRSPLKK
jgi:hypothetical protein